MRVHMNFWFSKKLFPQYLEAYCRLDASDLKTEETVLNDGKF